MNNILKIPAFQRKKAIPKQLKDLELNELHHKVLLVKVELLEIKMQKIKSNRKCISV